MAHSGGPESLRKGRNPSQSRDIESVMRSLVFLAAFAAFPVLAGAQNSRADQERISESVPVHMLPPAGKCRIWMVGVAPEQQPAPTDCQTALRQRPTNGVVVFGPVERESGASAFRGRPTVEPGPEQRPRTRATGQSPRETPRETPREPSREPSREPASAPVRAETRAPSTETRPASPAQPPSGTRRPTEDPVKKPPAVSPSVATSWELTS